MLGVPSLASRPDPIDLRGLERASSAVRRGLSGPVAWLVRRLLSACGRLTGTPELAELADDSAVTGFRGVWGRSAGRRRWPGLSGSRRSVALRSWPLLSRAWGSLSRDSGRKAGESSSSSSSSSLRPGRCIENFPNRLNRGFRRSSISSSPDSDSDDDELDESSSSSNVGDWRTGAACGGSRLVADGRRPKPSDFWSFNSAVGVTLREGSRALI